MCAQLPNVIVVVIVSGIVGNEENLKRQMHGCGTQPGARQQAHKRMRSEPTRNRKRDLVSSVRAQSAKCVTGQNTSEQRGSVEHIALC